MPGLSHAEYASLLRFRTALRRFERWSQQQARRAGLTPAQHQLLLTITGHSHRHGPTISDIADYLGVRHHSAVGLVDRASEAGLIVRTRDVEDARVIRITLTATGQDRIEQLSELHLGELSRLAPLLRHLTTSPDILNPDMADSTDATNQQKLASS
jgi:DNA-binding MarR family transcriptional regulator